MKPFSHFRALGRMAVILGLGATASALRAAGRTTVEQWGVFEITLPGPTGGNPFTDVELSARFTQGDRTLRAGGFYDGAGGYKVRFMPESAGEWRYETVSNRAELNGQQGAFTATAPAPGNHGPVRVHNTFHFAYADSTPFRPFGTTCYVWTHQGDALEEQTLKTLAASPFNKIRFCVFPKRFDFNQNEPLYYPFEGTPPNQWDFTRFNPEFFRHFEKRLGQLRDLGIEADIILFHPYDKGHWGFDGMGAANDDRYLRYVVARFAAFRNVWWSLANEFDLLESKQTADWDRFFQIIQASDPSQHLRSIHQDKLYYNHNQPWVTHASIQNSAAVLEYGRAMIYRDVYRKPIVFDEVKYEGDIPARWGNISAEDMVLRFWTGTVVGTYVGHGETFLDPHDILWWSKGGMLHGESPARIAFLKKIVEEGPAGGISPVDKWEEIGIGGQPGEYYLVYFGNDARPSWKFELFRTGLADGMKFAVEVIDTWNMTVTPVDGVFETKKRDAYFFDDKDHRSVPLPARPYLALRIRRQR
jgi:hypothetical protein